MMIRVGIPASFRRFAIAAREIGAPALVSANAFWNGKRFVVPRRDPFVGLDFALDSAGFVAMVRYHGYRWALDEYVAFAGAMRATWWAAPDYCCEPEIARDRAEVLERVRGTAFKLEWARRVAADTGVPEPMPVLQGWRPEDYLRCADMTPDLPDLVGVGSVCRREVGGPDGVLRVVGALDRRLARHVKLHLFGVKGTAIAALAGHPRVGSVDSAAWDAAARAKMRTGRTVEFRSGIMRGWYARQRAALGLFGADVSRETAA